MRKTVFKISKMDCPSEENLIKMKLSDIDSIKQLDFNLEERIITLYHNSNVNEIGNALKELKLNENDLESLRTTTGS